MGKKRESMRDDVTKIGRVLWGRTERPLTVFVPWDCGHHCPFCTTKKEYIEKYSADRLDEFFGLQKDALRRILPIGFVDEIVLTGGEPLADIPRLKELIGVIRDMCGFSGRLHVNTSLNFDEEKTAAAYDFLCEKEHGLDGIHIFAGFHQNTGAVLIQRHRLLVGLRQNVYTLAPFRQRFAQPGRRGKD